MGSVLKPNPEQQSYWLLLAQQLFCKTSLLSAQFQQDSFSALALLQIPVFFSFLKTDRDYENTLISTPFISTTKLTAFHEFGIAL